METTVKSWLTYGLDTRETSFFLCAVLFHTSFGLIRIVTCLNACLHGVECRMVASSFSCLTYAPPEALYSMLVPRLPFYRSSRV